MIKGDFSIILASASPRRRELLAEAGYEFRVVVSDVDEDKYLREGISSREFTERVAVAKAKSVAVEHRDSIVIGADTVVDFDGKIIGKATDATEARFITEKLFSSAHRVITGLAIVWLAKEIEMVDSDVTMVYPKRLTEEQIAGHIEGQSWRGRAGAYGIKESGDEFIERIEGSFTNVVGMPMELFEKMFDEAVSGQS